MRFCRKCPVGLFFDYFGTQKSIDIPLDAGSEIIFLMDLTRQWGKWIWKPTAEGFKMGATLIPFLPKDFEEKVKIALVELNEYQREMTAEYRRKKSGKNSAS